MKIFIVWAFLTVFIMLALMGVVTMMNHSKLSGGTCSSIGGNWTEANSEFECVMIEGNKNDH